MVKGQLIRSVASLKNLRPDPQLNPPVTRDLSGTLIRKKWKDTVIDYGTQASGDPVVQKHFLREPQVNAPLSAEGILQRSEEHTSELSHT